MGTLMQDEYVAGMWRGDLELGMLWCIDGFQGASTPTTYRAPTWSWMASVGRVWPAEPMMDGLSFIKVEKVHLDYVTEDTWGMLRGGWLHLRGHLKKLSLIDPDDWKMVVNGVQVEARTERDVNMHIFFDTPDNETDKESEPNLYCMIGKIVTDLYEGMVFVLVLELVNGETGTFKRIGIARGVPKDPELTFLADRAFYKSCDCSAHNNDPASENTLEPMRRDFMSRKVTSRNIQCLAVTLSSFLLLAQLVEGYWISRLFISVTTNRFTEWSEATSHFEPPVLHYMFNLPAILFLFATWTGIFSIGAVILDVQWRYTKELLKLNIKDLNKGHCTFAAETGNEKNGIEVDLECGLVLAGIEVPGNLFGTTYR
ncbi:hypothetical protein CEP54_000123 [Fusarium duplospermum]|uniref:Uncharacterized protein n=1 Tax=Fusarium duplospermum TaxID=1325734 RepID=A0A428R8R9_9HYPO|nr:hypothetical protein CEP54_000123 [Fusarium duplospermum]